MSETLKYRDQRVVEAARVLALRRSARKDFGQFCRLAGYEPAKHHLLLIEKLEAVVRGEIRRLLITMPPGSAKSTYSSVLFPPWFLAQRPRSAILTCSHSSDLAEAFGRRSRNLISDLTKVLGYDLARDSQAAGAWATDQGGEFKCAGVGTKIAGRRADFGLIDDPVGSREDALSKGVMDKAWEWYKYDFRTRLKPDAVVVLIQTRWAENDLAGRLLASEGSEWTVFNLPMLAKENDPLGRAVGEMLWPDYFTPELLADAQKDRMMFSALYQQDPTPEDGDYFRRCWIEDNAYDRDELPPLRSLTHYASSDHAVGTKENNDPSVFLRVGVDADGVIWVLPDLVWERLAPLEATAAMVGMMRRSLDYGGLRCWWAEQDKIGKSLGPFIRQEMKKQGIFVYIDEIHPSKDKRTRAQSIRGRFQAGTIRLPRFASWYSEAVLELLKFDGGMHDDFVDALAYIGLGLDKIVVGRGEAQPMVEVMEPPRITLDWIKKSAKRRRMREMALNE